MLKKSDIKKYILIALITFSALNIVLTVSAENIEHHTKQYEKRVSQLKKIDNIYTNKDGKVGGAFKLEDGTTARIHSISKDGTVYVKYKKRIVPYSNEEMKIFIQRSIGE